MAKNTTATRQPVTNAAPDIQAKLADTLEGNAEMLEGVKAAFKTLNDRDIKMSDKVLGEAIARAKNWNEMDDDAKMAHLLKVEETVSQVSVTDPGISKLVSKLDDDEFKQELTSIVVAWRKNKSSAVDMLAQLRRVFTEAELNGMPMPGLDKEHSEGTGYKPAKYKTVDRVSGDSISVNWVNDFADSISFGKEFSTTADLASKEAKSPNSTAFRTLDKDVLADVKAGSTSDRNALRSLMGRAIKLHHRLAAIGKLNAVGVRFIKGIVPKGSNPLERKGIQMPTKFGLGKHDPRYSEYVTSGSKPIWLYDVDDPSRGREYSVTQILAMNPQLARLGENGGNRADLVATAGKGPDDEEQADGSKAGETMPDDEAQATGSMFINFFSKTENRASVLKAIADYKKNSDGVEWLGIVMEMDRLLHPIAEKNRNTYLAIQNAKLLNADNEAEENLGSEAVA